MLQLARQRHPHGYKVPDPRWLQREQRSQWCLRLRYRLETLIASKKSRHNHVFWLRVVVIEPSAAAPTVACFRYQPLDRGGATPALCPQGGALHHRHGDGRPPASNGQDSPGFWRWRQRGPVLLRRDHGGCWEPAGCAVEGWRLRRIHVASCRPTLRHAQCTIIPFFLVFKCLKVLY